MGSLIPELPTANGFSMGRSAFFEEHKNKLWFMTLRQFLRHKMAVFGMVIMAVIVLMVVFVDQIVPYDPETPDLNNMLSPPVFSTHSVPMNWGATCSRAPCMAAGCH